MYVVLLLEARELLKILDHLEDVNFGEFVTMHVFAL